MDLAAALIAWAAAACCLPSLRHGRRHLLFLGLAGFAVSMTLQVPTVYMEGEALLGGKNHTNLLYRTVFLFAALALDLAILRTRSRSLLRPRTILVAGGIGVLVVLQWITFWAGEWPRSDVHLDPYFGSPRATAYVAILWLALGLLATDGMWSVLSHVRRHPPRSSMRVGLLLVAAGCGLSLVWVFRAVTDVGVDLLTGSGFGQPGKMFSDVLLLGAVLFICVGLTIAPFGALRERVHLLRLMLNSASPARQARQALPETRSSPWTWALAVSATGQDRILYRRYADIADAVNLRVITLTPADDELLLQLEARLGSTLIRRQTED